MGGIPMNETLEQALWETIIRMKEKSAGWRERKAFSGGERTSLPSHADLGRMSRSHGGKAAAGT